MPTTVARLVSTTATSTGTQDFTTADLGGLTPKAALFIISFATAADADTTHASFGMGVAVSATSRYCVATAVEDGQGTQDAYRCGFNNACIAIINPSGTAATAYADFSSWLTDGVRINWVAAPSAARRIEIIFFAGTDLTVNNIGVVTINGSNGADKSLSGLTGSPNAAFFLTARQGFTAATTSLTAGSPGRHVIGMAVKDTGEPNSTRQAGFYRRVDSGGSNENYRTNIWNNRVAGMDANGSRYWRLAVEGWPTNGITLFQRDHDGFDSDQIAVLPLQFAGSGQGVWCGVVDTKTSTGTQAYTNPGWKPDFLFTGGTYRSAIDVTTTLWGDQTAESETSGWGGTTATAAGFQSWRGVDGGGTSSTKSRSSTQSLDVIGGAGTVRYRATLSSFDTTGWTWNFSTADGTARKVLVFAHQEAAPAITPKTDTDTGTLTDSEVETAAYTQTESGTLTDTEVETATYADDGPGTATDAATLTDSEVRAAAYTDTDTGTLTDSEVATAAATDTDAATLTDSEVQAFATTDTDTATLTDSEVETAALTDTESGTLTDDETLDVGTTAVTDTDTVALTDDEILTADHLDVDTATHAESETLVVDLAVVDDFTHLETEIAAEPRDDTDAFTFSSTEILEVLISTVEAGTLTDAQLLQKFARAVSPLIVQVSELTPLLRETTLLVPQLDVSATLRTR